MTGMLWYDNSGSDPKKIFKSAADYYQRKYGAVPSFFYVNRFIQPPELDGVDVKVMPELMANHFVIGCNLPNAKFDPQGQQKKQQHLLKGTQLRLFE